MLTVGPVLQEFLQLRRQTVHCFVFSVAAEQSECFMALLMPGMAIFLLPSAMTNVPAAPPFFVGTRRVDLRPSSEFDLTFIQ